MTVLHARRVRRRLPPPSGEVRADHVRALGRLVARSRRARAWANGDEVLLGRCVAGAVLVAVALATSVGGARAPAAVPLGAWLGWRGGVAWSDRASLAAAAGARKALPVMLDRLSTCVLAGMSIERALRVVAPGTPGPLGVAVTDGLRALDLGMPRAQAYERIASRAAADEVKSLMMALARAERFGTAVAPVLGAQAHELRARARAAAETDARTAPVKLVFPLVFCFLPAFVVLTIAPIAIGAFRTLGGL